MAVSMAGKYAEILKTRKCSKNGHISPSSLKQGKCEKATRMMYSNFARIFQPLQQTSLLELLS